MIELERHIEILLLDNDCVIVPGLGGFMAHHVSAHYDEQEQLFLPPLRTLGFNPKLHINDFLLAQSYIEAYDISYPEAINRINDEVSELKQHLENEGSYELNDIGTLSLNEDGNYEFVPCEAGMLTPELYGLSSFEIAPKEIPATAVVKEEEEKENPLPEADADSEENKPLEYYLQPSEEEESSHIKIRISTLRNAVAIAAIILAFFLISTPLGNSDGQSVNMSNLNTSLLQKVMPKEVETGKADVADNIILNKVEEPATAKSPGKEKETMVEKEAPAPKSHYSLVLASCVSNHNAKVFVEQLKKDGYQEVEIIQRKNGAKVIYGHYDNENDAYNALNELHAQEPFKEAWVYFVKR